MNLLVEAFYRHQSRPARTLTPPLATRQPVHARPLSGMGPHTRILPVGRADARTVRLALTVAWRRAGQPLDVVLGADTDPGVRAAARAWCSEHQCAGHELSQRHTTLAATPGQVLDLDEPEPCPGCTSPLCEQCAGPIGGQP